MPATCPVCNTAPATHVCVDPTDASGPAGHVRCAECTMSTCAGFDTITPHADDPAPGDRWSYGYRVAAARAIAADAYRADTARRADVAWTAADAYRGDGYDAYADDAYAADTAAWHADLAARAARRDADTAARMDTARGMARIMGHDGAAAAIVHHDPNGRIPTDAFADVAADATAAYIAAVMVAA